MVQIPEWEYQELLRKATFYDQRDLTAEQELRESLLRPNQNNILLAQNIKSFQQNQEKELNEFSKKMMNLMLNK